MTVSVLDCGADMARAAVTLCHTRDKRCLAFIASKGNTTDEKPKIASQTKAVTERQVREAITKIIVDSTETVHTSFDQMAHTHEVAF